MLHRVILLHVLFTQQTRSEVLVTHGAFERLDVDDHVTVQAAVGGEGGIADITLEGFHSCQRETRMFALTSLNEAEHQIGAICETVPVDSFSPSPCVSVFSGQ